MFIHDVSVCSALHYGVLKHLAFTPDFAALKEKLEKNSLHKELIELAGG